MKNQSLQKSPANQPILNQTLPQKKKLKYTIKQIHNIIDLGFYMKFVLMHNDSIKIVQQTMKLINSSNKGCFMYVNNIKQILNKVKQNIGLMFGQGQQFCIYPNSNNIKLSQNYNNINTIKQQIIKKIVSQLYNARQDALKIQQHDSNINFGLVEQNQGNLKDIKYYLGKQMEQFQQSNGIIQEYKINLQKLQAQNKYNKKLLQDSSQNMFQKDDKIVNFKNTIARLQQYIIKQVKSQSQTQNKSDTSDINTKIKAIADSLVLKIQKLQKQNIQLKKQLQTYKNTFNNSQIIPLKSPKKQHINDNQIQKQYFSLTKQFSIIKSQINQIIKSNSRVQTQYDENIQNNQQEQMDIIQSIKINLQTMTQKYNMLEQTHKKMKQQYQSMLKMQSSSRIFKSSHYQIQSAPFRSNQDSKQKQKKMNKSWNKKSRNFSITGNKLVESDQEQIMRDINNIKGINQQIGITSFQSVINSNQISKKIEGFQYNNSIINKVNCSKFIQTFQAKLSLVLQYVCLLQLYFSRNFLSCIRQQLMMQDNLSIKTLKISDLNPNYMQINHQQNSFIAINTSKLSSMSSSNKMLINNQFSITQTNNKNESNSLSQSTVSLPNRSLKSASHQKTQQKIQKLQQQIKQLLSIIPNQYLNPHEIRDDPQFISRLQKLKQNSIAVVMTNLIKQNEIFKKCLNQMIKSQQNFTKQNNQVYFDQDGQIKKRSNTKIKQPNINNSNNSKNNKDTQNCSIF